MKFEFYFLYFKRTQMLKTHKFATLAILAALAINPAFAEEKSAAVVNGHAISQERVEMAVKGAVAQGQTDTPELRKAIREKMISLELVAQLQTDHFFTNGFAQFRGICLTLCYSPFYSHFNAFLRNGMTIYHGGGLLFGESRVDRQSCQNCQCC